MNKLQKTEEDKELRRLISDVMADLMVDVSLKKLLKYDGGPIEKGRLYLESHNNRLDIIMQLTTADRERAVLEAELQLLTYLLCERTEHMFMQNQDTGEMTGNGRVCNRLLSAVSANRIEAERRRRITELKAK